MDSEQERRSQFSRVISDKVRGADIRQPAIEEDRAKINRDQTGALVVLSVGIGIGIALASDAWAADQELPWIAAHPELTGAIAFLLALVLGRTYLFMLRLESS